MFLGKNIMNAIQNIGKINPETLDELRDLANENIDQVLSELGVDIDNTTLSGNEIRSVCPIHDGADNPTAFCYNTTYKYWRCYTHGCGEGCANIFGLIQKLLGKNTNRTITFKESVGWLAKILNYELNYETVEYNEDDLALNNLLKKSKRKNRQSETDSKFKSFPIQLIDGKIEPSPYFLKQGFSHQVLKKYNVGYCDDPNKPMYCRSYAPVLNDSGSEVVGVTGRTIYEECQYCGGFHKMGKGCPKDNPTVKSYPKWLHYNFKKNEVFYNINFAERYIRDTKTVILVEGPKDIWWLNQYGAHNCLCLFGLSASEYHLKRLIHLGVSRIIIALNNDERGIEAAEKLNYKFENYFRMINIYDKLNGNKDIAELPENDMVDRFVPYLKSLEFKKCPIS